MTDFLLLETGDYLLQEDGSSKIILDDGLTGTPLAATLSFRRELQDPAHFEDAPANCYFHDSYVCCLTESRYRWMHWEGRKPTTASNLDESQVRLFESTDEGASWSLLIQFDVPTRTQWNVIYSPSGDRILAGMFDGADYAYDSNYSVIAVSDDAGLTWASGVTSGVFGTFGASANTAGFVMIPGTQTILAFGLYSNISGGSFNFLRSTDNGTTFTAFADAGASQILDCIALTATDLVATDGTNPFYSSDGGATWNPGTKPAIGDVLGDYSLAAVNSTTVMTVGRHLSAAGAFISTDSGQTYSFLAALPGGENNSAETLIKISDTMYVAGGNTTSPGLLQMWWLTEDTGATWTQTSFGIPSARIANSDSTSLLVTTDGHLLAAVDQPTRASTATDNVSEVWRGTITGLTDYTATCAGALENIFAGTWVDTQMVPVFA